MLDLAWEYSYSNMDSSRHYSIAGIELATNRKDEEALANAKSMLAIVCDIEGEMEKAAELYLEVADYYQNTSNLVELSKTYNNLGVLFFYNDLFEKSLEYYEKSMVIDQSLGDSIGVGESLVNLAAIANKNGDYEKAMDMLLRGKHISDQNPTNHWLRQGIFEGLANTNLYEGQIDSSEAYFKKAIQLFQDSNDINGVLSCLNGLISTSISLEKFDEARTYLKEAEKLAEDYDDVFRRRKRNQLAAELFAAIKDFEMAFRYQLRYQADHDSINRQDRIRSSTELEEKYQAEQKEKEIARLELTQQQAKNQRNVLILLSALILGVSALIFVLYRFKAKANAAISKSLGEKETLLKEIHHRVKNNLQVVSSLLSMQSRFIDDETALGAVSEGQARVESMALIHQKLYQDNQLSGVAAKEYIEDLSEILGQSYATDTEVGFEFAIDDLTIDVDTIIPIGLILNELICNSLKHAFKELDEGIIRIELREKEHQLQLEVSDNGIGTTASASDQSFGKVLIDSLARKLKATLLVETENGTKTTLQIEKYKLV